jgi:hypothetical protein
MLSRPELDAVTYAYDGAIRIDEGDLMWHNTDDGKPASSIPPGANEAADAATLAAAFAGIAKERKLTSDLAGTVDVVPDIVRQIDCVSNTFEVGDYVSGTRDGGGALVRQKVKKTATANERIGVVVKREPVATTKVWVRFMSTVTPNRQLLA